MENLLAMIQRRRPSPLTSRILAVAVLLSSLATYLDAKTTNHPPAKLQVTGFGWLGNRELRRTIRSLQKEKKAPPTFDANFVEDAAFILLSTLTRDGYLAPIVRADLILEDGSTRRFVWNKAGDTLLPRPLAVKKASFRIERGVLYRYKKLTISGLHSLSKKKARNYFVQSGFLISTRTMRVYTPSRFKQSVAALREALARQGYESAAVQIDHLTQNPVTGAVHAKLSVHEGSKTSVRSVTTHVFTNSEPHTTEITLSTPGQAYSKLWLQDLSQSLRTNQYRKGFPDVSVDVSVTNRQTNGPNVYVDLDAQVRKGPKIRLGNVRFEGNEKTKVSVLEHRLRIVPGQPLDRIEVEQTRNRLARLGALESVAIRYEPVDDETRDVIYELKEGKALDVSLLLGYGSYELLRGGVELEYKNAFNLSHQARLRGVQSFKSSSADFLYTVPDALTEDVSLFLNGSGLRREEVSFTREEYGGGIGTRKFLRPTRTDLGARYNYEHLNAIDSDLFLDPETIRVGSLIFDIRQERRDNPLLPTKGYDFAANTELASKVLGGQVDFQRVEIAGSYHANLFGQLFLHLGLRHGAAMHLTSSANEIPFTKRFFPGGENSVRGFQQGEASPLDAAGNQLGAETYLLGNIELEQFVTPSISLVGFIDAVGFAEHISDYPQDEDLYSVGGGVRWKSIVGPVRLEYGRNLNPRPRDPSGTLHFSIGFPF
jgi:outer membrane protein assembly complex protein YaeT